MTVDLSWGSGLQALTRRRLIGIIRGYPREVAVQAATIAHDEGLDVLEVTMDSPHAVSVVGDIAEELPGATVGVGTVTNPGQIDEAMAAGASFIVTPIYSASVITRAGEKGVPVISGAASPTEIHRALEAGAVAVKVFPAALLGGPAYLRAVRAPLGNPPLIPTGGVTLDSAAEYLENGAVALGAGSGLFTDQVALDGDWQLLRRLVAEWMRAVR